MRIPTAGQATGLRKARAFEVDQSLYTSHALHRGERDWSETNCYVDVWIELLNVMGFEPLAALGFCLGIDLEGDQFTFYKFPAHELRQMFGLTVFEINPWVSMLDQTIGELNVGHPILIEVDSWYLPDTAGTAYRTSHVKTTIGALAIDVDSKTCQYVHNQSMYQLSGDDFHGVFRTDAAAFAGQLPSYMEAVKSHGTALSGTALLSLARELLGAHIKQVPATNPFIGFADRLPTELAARCHLNAEMFHAYCFATFRQFGSAFSLAASHLEWLSTGDPREFAPAIEAFRSISTTAKTLQMKSARAALAGKPLAAAEQLTKLIESWETGIGYLRDVG